MEKVGYLQKAGQLIHKKIHKKHLTFHGHIIDY